MHDTVANGIGEGGIADDVEPFCHRDLGGNDGGCAVIAVFDDLQQREAGLGVECQEPEVIEDEDGGMRDAGNETLIASFRTLDPEKREELAAVEVERLVSEVARLRPEGLGKEAFAVMESFP